MSFFKWMIGLPDDFETGPNTGTNTTANKSSQQRHDEGLTGRSPNESKGNDNLRDIRQEQSDQKGKQ